jgi:hypothetical protein
MRVSLPMSTAGPSRCGGATSARESTLPAAYASLSAKSGVIGGLPTRPRMPSVPKNFRLIAAPL